jgi:hypothetical protein
LTIGAACLAFGIREVIIALLVGSVLLGSVLLGSVLLAAVLRIRFEPALKAWNVLLAFYGNAVGAGRAFRGKRAITWDPPASARRAGSGVLERRA